MTIKTLIAGTACALLATLATSGVAMAQDSAAPSGSIDGFNSCVETNTSLLIPQGDLVQLCLNQHAAPMDRALVSAQGSYRQTENGLIFCFACKTPRRIQS